jgi:hypothetical protein
MNPGWYFISPALGVLLMIALNESGYGVFALLLLPLVYWLMEKAFGYQEPSD